jgi:hypothetical protein
MVVEMDPRTDPPNRSSEERQLLDSAQSKLFCVFINDPKSIRRSHAVDISMKCIGGKAIVSGLEPVTGLGS